MFEIVHKISAYIHNLVGHFTSGDIMMGTTLHMWSRRCSLIQTTWSHLRFLWKFTMFFVLLGGLSFSKFLSFCSVLPGKNYIYNNNIWGTNLWIAHNVVYIKIQTNYITANKWRNILCVSRIDAWWCDGKNKEEILFREIVCWPDFVCEMAVLIVMIRHHSLCILWSQHITKTETKYSRFVVLNHNITDPTNERTKQILSVCLSIPK